MQRNTENELLLTDAPAQDADQTARLPRDVLIYLLGFCTLQDIVALAQVNKKFHAAINNVNFNKLFEARAMFSVFEIAVEHPVTDAVAKPGYVKGTYAQLRDVLAERKRALQRIPELAATRCMGQQEGCNEIGKIMLGAGAVWGAFGSGFTAFLYFTLSQSAKVGAAVTAAGLTSPACLLVTGGAACFCASKHIKRKIQERDELKNNLVGAPSVAQLHGATFSWKPTENQKDQPPAQLNMQA